jgi:lipopolysaccharide cholinephosphotransferase
MATIEQVQDVEFELLQFLHDICEENGLTYTLSYGTMLGAYRHRGFIPWDDDVDVQMPIKDVRKLIKLFNSSKYFLQCPDKDIRSPFMMLRLRKNGTVMKDKAIWTKMPIHQGIWCDIFPYTNAGNNKVTRKLQLVMRKVLQSYRCRYLHAELHPDRKIYIFLSKIPAGPALWIDYLMQDIIRALGSRKSDDYYLYGVSDKIFFKKDFFDNRKLYPFRDASFWGPADANGYLIRNYGPNYMTPKQWSHLQDYSDVVL